MQLLNASASFVNISLDSNEKLLELVSSMETIAEKANKGNVYASTARRYRTEIDDLARKFDEAITEATDGEQDFFDPTELEGSLVQAGLDPKKVSELAVALRKFSSPAETTVGSDGSVSTNGNPVPLAEFQRALRSVVFDDTDPTEDKSGFFSKIKKELQDIRIKLTTNISALKGTAKLIGDNMTLVRAAGFAFLDVSNEMNGSESADQIAEQLRARIRGSAGAVITQAQNLEPIMVAGLAALSTPKE
jgi:hypothetical protein